MAQHAQSWSAQAFIVVSVAYVAAYSAMTGFVTPLQSIAAPDLADIVSLLFLPHGVRILSIYYFGWRAIVYLMPASSLMWYLSVQGLGQDLHIGGTFVSVFACYAGVFLTRSYIGEREGSFTRFSWRMMIVAGVLGSVFNSVGLSVLYFGAPPPLLMAAYVFGDVMGQVALMLILIMIFRLMDQFTPPRP